MALKSINLLYGKSESVGSVSYKFTGVNSPANPYPAKVVITFPSGTSFTRTLSKGSTITLSSGGISRPVTLVSITTLSNEQWMITLSVDDGKSTSAYGYVRFESIPTGADIYVDGVKTGLRTNATYSRVPLGIRTFRMEKAGYKTFEAAANITAANTSSNPFPVGHNFTTPPVVTPPVVTPAVLTTKLTISPSVKSLAEGTQMKFTGRLLTTDNKPISGAQILFYKDTTVDTQLKNSGTVIKATTDSNGNYAMYWYADNSNWTSSLVHNIYASYAGAGSKSYKSCKSSNCQVTITPVQNRATKVSFSISPTSTTAGTTVKFTGAVLAAQKIGSTTNYLPAPGATVLFYWVRAGWPDSPITVNGKALSVTTSNTGSFSASWVAVDLDGNPDTDTYSIKAVVQKTPLYASSSTTTNPKITISAGTGSLNCTSTPAGATVYIDGKLQSQKTPRTFTGLAVGTHTVEFRLEGYTTVSKQAVISKQGATTTVSATLVATVKTTTLTLNSPGSSFFVGDRITFGGTLKDSTGAVVPGVTIELMKQNGSGITDAIPDVSLKNGSTTVKATTDKFGNFSVYWTAVDMNLTPGVTSHKIYARFTGTTAYTKSNSRVYDIAIKPKEALATVLNITVSPTAAKVGGIIAISGTLKTIEGTPVPAATITFHDDQYIIDSELKNGSTVLKATTTTSGTFSVNWTAALLESLTSSDTVKIYAKYAGHILYKASQSATKEVTVTKDKITPTVSLSTSPSTVAFGSTVTLSGYLMDPSTNKGIANAKVTIYDKDDILNLTNDTIGIATTNASGYYTLSWIAREETILNATTSTIEMMAQFEATNEYNKATSTVKPVTVILSGITVNFTSTPRGATVEVDGVKLLPLDNKPNITPFAAKLQAGAHTAKFYFEGNYTPWTGYYNANSEWVPYEGTNLSGIIGENAKVIQSKYAPITKTFTINAQAGLQTVEGKWQEQSICSLLGMNWAAEECQHYVAWITAADIMYDLSSFTRRLFGRNIYGKEEAAGRIDDFCIIMALMPMAKVATKPIKFLKDIVLDTGGIDIAKAVMKDERLMTMLDSSLVFNRLGSMTKADVQSLISRLKGLGTSATAAQIKEIGDWIKTFKATPINEATLADMQTTLRKIFPDSAVGNMLEFLRRAVPESEFGKLMFNLFSEFLAGRNAPSPQQMIELAKAGKADPVEIVNLFYSMGFTQMRTIEWKLRYINGNGFVAADMLDELSTLLYNVRENPTTYPMEEAVVKIKSICSKYETTLTNQLATGTKQILATITQNLGKEYQNAIYAMTKTAGDKYVAAMKAAYKKYGITGWNSAAKETIEQSVDIIVDTVKKEPTTAIVTTANTALVKAYKIADDLASEIPTTQVEAELAFNIEILRLMQKSTVGLSDDATWAIYDMYYHKELFGITSTSATQTRKALTELLELIVIDIPKLTTTKGTKITSYSSFNVNELIKNLAYQAKATELDGAIHYTYIEIMSALERLKNSGIEVIIKDEYSTTIKKLIGGLDNYEDFDIVGEVINNPTHADDILGDATKELVEKAAKEKAAKEAATKAAAEKAAAEKAAKEASAAEKAAKEAAAKAAAEKAAAAQKAAEEATRTAKEAADKKEVAEKIAENIKTGTPTETAESLSTKYAEVLRMFSDSEQKIARGYVNLLTNAAANEFTKIILSDGTTLASKKGFDVLSILKKILYEIDELGLNEKTGSNVRHIISDISSSLRDDFLKLVDHGLSITTKPPSISGLADDITKLGDDVLEKLPSELPDDIEEIADIVQYYQSFFKEILTNSTSIRITPGVINGLMDYLIKNPHEIYNIINTSETTELFNKLYAYGNDGKSLAEFVRIVKKCKEYEVLIGRETNFDAFITTTIKAAKKLYAAGDDPTLIRLWDTMFDAYGNIKTIDELCSTSYFKEYYKTINSMSLANPSDWKRMWTWAGDSNILKALKIIETRARSPAGLAAIISGGTLFLVYARVFQWEEYKAAGLRMLGIAPGQEAAAAKSMEIAINGLISTLNYQCTSGKGTTKEIYAKDLEGLHTKIEEYRTYGKVHEAALKKASTSTENVTVELNNTLITLQPGPYSTYVISLDFYDRTYGRLSNAEACPILSGSTTPSTGTGTGGYDSVWASVDDQSYAIGQLYNAGKDFHDAGNTTEVIRISADHKRLYDTLMGYIAQNYQSIKDHNHTVDVQAITKLHYNHQVLLTAWSKEGNVTGPLETGIVDQMVEDIKWKIIKQYGTCDDLLDSASSELTKNIETLEDLIAEAEDMLEEYASQISELGRTGELQDTIDIAKGRLDVYAASGNTGPGNTSLYTTITSLLKDLESSRWGCRDFFDAANNTALAGLLPTYADQITRLQTIRTDNATEVETLGLTKELEDKYNYYNSYYVYYSGQAVTGTPTTELPTDSALYEQIDSKIYDLNTFYWNCYKAKKRGDTTTFNSNFTIFKRMLQELKDMQSSKAAEITDIGYTNTVADAIADYSTKVIELSSSSSSSGSTDNPSTPTTPTTPDDSDTSGGDYTNETYNKASALIDKIDTNSNTCWTHCKAGAKSALTAALKTYVSNHNALKKLYTEHLPELKSAKADTWVKNDIDYHTSDLAKLTNCASTSSGTEDPVDEPDTTDMTDTEVIDTVDQYLDDMDKLWDEGQNATTANTTEVA